MERNPENFHFFQKRGEAVIVFSVGFAGSHYRGRGTGVSSVRLGPRKLLPRNHTLHLRSSVRAQLHLRASASESCEPGPGVMDRPFLDLFCVSASKMCPEVLVFGFVPFQHMNIS